MQTVKNIKGSLGHYLSHVGREKMGGWESPQGAGVVCQPPLHCHKTDEYIEAVCPRLNAKPVF